MTVIHASEGYYVLRASWKLIKPRFLTALFICLIYVTLSFFTQFLPWINNLIWGFTQPLLSAGIVLIADKWYRSESVEFTDFFYPFQHRPLFQRLLPICIFSSIVNFVGELMSSNSSDTFLIIRLMVTITIFAVGWMIVWLPTIQMTFEEISFQESVKRALLLMLKNWEAFLVNTLCVAAIFLLSIGTLGLGFVFLGPVLFFSTYFWYLVLYKNFSSKNYVNSQSEFPS